MQSRSDKPHGRKTNHLYLVCTALLVCVPGSSVNRKKKHKFSCPLVCVWISLRGYSTYVKLVSQVDLKVVVSIIVITRGPETKSI